MFDDYYWEPPQAVTRLNILNEYHRFPNRRMLSTGKRLRDKTIGQSEASILIERFVRRVISNTKPAYEFRRFAGLHETNIGFRLREMISLLGFFDSIHDYSEDLCAFLDACWLIESMCGLDLSKIGRNDYRLSFDEAEAMNMIVEKIRKNTSEGWYQRAAYDRRYEANEKANHLSGLTANILGYYARTMIVRMNFYYYKSARKRLTIDDVYDHLDQFKNLMEQHPVFAGLVGHAFAVEQGERKGFHIHAVFFFDGSKKIRHKYKGYEIGAVWEQMVGPVTYADTSNAHIHKLPIDEIGIGLIYRSDEQACLKAIEVVRYIAKEDQYLRIKPKGRRTFFSSFGLDFGTRRGRPVSQVPGWDYVRKY